VSVTPACIAFRLGRDLRRVEERLLGLVVTWPDDDHGDAALLAAAAVVIGVWIRFVLFGDGERELRRIERVWGPRRVRDEGDD
jgi:hypothetical protein